MAGTDDHAGEAGLRDLLVAENREGARWQRFAEVIARLRSEAIFRMCADKGYPLGGPPPSWEPRTAEKAFGDLRRAGVVVSHLRRDVLVPDLARLRGFVGRPGSPSDQV